MRAFVISRTIRSLFVVLGLIAVTFLLTRSFSDPARLMLPLDAPEADYLALRDELGLDKPLLEQAVRFVGDALVGDFGESTWQRADAFDVVIQKVPATLMLGFAAVLLAIVIGFPLGLAAGRRPGSFVDRMGSRLAAIAVSVPDYWLGILLILLFAVQLGWLPTSGYGGIQYLVLPVLALALRPIGRCAAIVREATREQMAQRYVATARSKGLTERAAVRRHVVKNVVPVAMTVLAYDFVFIFTGYAAYVETVFEWPGVGKLAVDAVLHHDVNLIGACVFVAGIVVALVNILVDLVHAMIDRRVELS